MKLLLSWLREFVDVDLPASELARRMLDATAEVESWETIGADWDPERIRVAEVVAVEPHPNADRLRLATVETGSGRQQVVCGAPNVAVGQKVAFATEGAEIVDGHTGQKSKLKLRPIRGVDSAGMVLSEKELGLSDDHEGILVLPPDAPIGRPLSEQMGDVLFDISTWANRADLLGVLGLARETAAFTGKELREPDRTHGEGTRAVSEFIDVSIEDPDLCRRFTASIIQNVTIGPSPEWMQERLLHHGMRPISNVVDITNYVMLETGQPIHAFDYDLVRGEKIVARRARPGERLVTLDGIDRELDPEMLMICDGEGPVGIAGIMGGGNSEVSDRTKTVLLEIANFKPGSIRRSSTRLKLRTEASLRFEKGIGPDLAEYAQHRALRLFEELTGATVARGIVDVYPGKQHPPAIALTDARIVQVLGIPVPPGDVTRILESLGYSVRPDPGGFAVEPPFWRTDVEIPDDVIEDIGRIHGYHQLPSTALRGSLPVMEPDPLVMLRERLRDLAVAAGFQEVITYTLNDGSSALAVVNPDDATRTSPLNVVNPVGVQYKYLRTSLRASLLSTYAANRGQAEGALRLFEIGFEYLPTESDLPHERAVLCAVFGGSREGRWPRTIAEHLDFFDGKGALESILKGVGVELNAEAASHFGFLEGHTADILVRKERVGVLGQVHPEVAARFHLREPVFIAELWPEDLVRTVPNRPSYLPPSRYPDVRQDVALLLDAEVPAGRVVRLVRSHRSGSINVSADVFDEYRGAGVPEGKKSLALRLRYQAPDRTLTDDDVARIQAGLVTRLQKELGATLRGG